MIGRAKIVLKLTFIIALVTYTLWSFIKEETGIRIFYPGVALSFVGYTYTILLLLTYIRKQSTNYSSYKKIVLLANIIFLATVHNLIDELFFDPTLLQLNEYIGFVVIIIITYFKNGKYDSRGKERNV